MARIREYTATAQLDPSVGVYAAQAQARAGDDAARAIQQIGGAVQGVVKTAITQQDRDDTARLALELPQTMAEINVAWAEKANAWDGKDPDFADKFIKEQAETRFEKIGQGVNSEEGRQYFDKIRSNYMADLYQKAHSDRISLSGKFAVNGLEATYNQILNGIRTDPTSFESQRSMGATTLDTYVRVHGLPAADAAMFKTKLNSEAALAAGRAMVDANPTAAKMEIAKGRFNSFLDAKQTAGLIEYAKVAEEGKIQDEKAANVSQKKALKEDFDSKMRALGSTLVTEDGKEQVPADYFKTWQTLTSHPGADLGELNAMRNAAIAILNREEKGETARTDKAIYSKFEQRMSIEPGQAGSLTKTEIFQAQAEGKLSTKDASFFKSWIDEESKDPLKVENRQQLNIAVDSHKSIITQSNAFGKMDPRGDILYGDFRIKATERFNAGLREGKTAQQLLDRSSPHYILKPEFVYQFRPSKAGTQEAVRSQMQGGEAIPPPVVLNKPRVLPGKAAPASKGPSATVPLQNAAPPRKPDESTTDYLKRKNTPEKGAALRGSITDMVASVGDMANTMIASVGDMALGMGGGDEVDLQQIDPVVEALVSAPGQEPNLKGLTDAQADEVISRRRAERLMASMSKGKSKDPAPKPRSKPKGGDVQKMTGSTATTLAPRTGRPKPKE